MAKVFNTHFHRFNEAQKGLAESIYQLSLKESTLHVSLLFTYGVESYPIV